MTTFKSKTAKAVVGLVTALFVLVGANTAAASYNFATNLKMGMTSPDVQQLQMVLNMSADTQVSASGAGSPGMESSYFGAKTLAAVIKYQNKNHITPPAGFVGAITRGMLNTGQVNNPNNPPVGGLCPNGMTLASNCTMAPVTGTQTGPVAAALATDNPASGNILSGQGLADLAHFTFSGSGTLTQVTLQRTGLSVSGDISNAYLFDGNQRLTDGASVNTNGQIVFSGLNVAVNGSRTLSVRVDMASSVSSVTLGVTLTGFTANGTVTTVNIAGNLHYVSSAPSGSTTATLNASNLGTTATINAGLTGYTVWSNGLQINGRSAWLKGLNLRVIGSAPTDALQNVRLYVDGTAVGSPVMVSSAGYAFFDLGMAPVSLTTGTHTIEVRGDVQKGSNRSFQFSLQYGADLMLTDSQLGINVAATSAVTNGAGPTVTISSGSVTTTVDPTFQTMTNVTGGATNAPIARFRLHAYGEDVKVNTLTVTPTLASQSSVSAAGLNNVTLFFNGSQVGSSTNMTASTTQALSFSPGSAMTIPAGVDSTLEVRADLTTYSTNLNYVDGTISVTLPLGVNNAQGMTSLDSTIDVPASAITSSSLTIQTGSLSVAKNTAYANQSVTPNTSNAKIASFVLQNQGTSEGVHVTNLAVALALTGTNNASTNLSNLRTSETSGSGSTPINPGTAAANATSSNNFSVDFTLAPGATKTIDVFADISSATGTVAVALTPTARGSNSNVSATPSAVTGQTITIQTGSFTSQNVITSASTTAQFIAAANGKVDGSVARFNLVASNGAATVTEAKFVVRGSSTVSALGTVASVRIGSASAPIVLATTNSTTLSTQLTSAQTVATIASGTGVSMGSIFLIDSEQILVATSVDATHWNVSRAYNGTSAATHAGAATVSVMNGVADITGLNIAVPNSTAGVNVDAQVTYSPVGTNGVTSGSVSALSLGYLRYTIGNTTQTSCVASLSCTNALVESSSTAPTMTMVGSKPVVTVQNVTASLAVASTPAIDMTITPDAQGDITLVSFPITVGLNGASVSTSATNNIAVYIGSDLSTNYAASNTAFSGATGGSSTITLTNSGYRISAGVPTVFHVYVTPVGVAAATSGSDSMATSLATGSGFSWTDTAGGGSATTGTSNIYGYPSSTTVIVRN